MRMSFYPVVFFSLVSVSCAMKTAHREPDQVHGAKMSQVDGVPQVADSHSHETPATPAQAAAHAPAHHEALKGTEPEKALGWLKNGNTRFVKASLRKDGQSKKDIVRLSKGQQPHTIVLSCSDSRVPPEIVFDQKLGEIFTVRNAGEIPDQATIASIEYAVEHLGSRLLVVMGHTSCGAVKAALGTLDGGDAGSPSLNALVHDIHPRLASFKGRMPSSNDVATESWANTKGIAHDLLERSQILRERVASGDLKIQTALYHLDDGKVDFTP
jgi:carbonic anhydrase